MAAYLDIIVLLAIVVMVFLKLKAILGTRPSKEAEISQESAAKIFDILVKEQEKKQAPATAAIHGGELEAKNMAELSETDKALLEIPGFAKDRFVNNAKKAFEMIVVSFASGDTQSIEPLIGKALFKKFQEVVVQRKADNVVAETDLIAFNDAQIVDAKITKNNVAKIVVKFVTEQVNILKNATGEIIEGDENFIQSVTDIWTFERAISSKTPNWLLTSTKK